MPINFPNSPSPSQLYTYDNKTWEWNGTYWEVYSALTSYITSAYTVGDGFSDISGVTGGNIALKSFSGVNLTIIDNGEKLTFSAASQPGVVLSYYVSGSTPSGVTLNSGDRWLDTNTGDELVWVDDGDSQQWIQIASVVGGGGGTSTSTGVTFIASSNCVILSDGDTYIGYSKAGWSYFAWDVVYSSFSYDTVDCGIPMPENIVEGQTINVCGVAYSAGLSSEVLRLRINKLSCSDLSVITNVYSSDNQFFDSNGNLCFSIDYLVGSGEDFIKCSDFIVLGFQGVGITGNNIKISYKITAS